MSDKGLFEVVKFSSNSVVGLSRNWKTGYQGDRHYHDCGQLIYVTKGSLLLDYESNIDLITPQQGSWIPPGCPHSVSAISNANIRSIYFNAFRSKKIGLVIKNITIKPIVREMILELFNSEFSVGTNQRCQMIAKYLELELTYSKEQLSAQRIPVPSNVRLKAIVEDVLINPKVYMNRGFWSDSIGMSGRTIDRIFKSDIGISFSAWKMKIIYSEMMRRLLGGTPPSVVAIELGYSELSSFTKSFKRKYGYPPTKYYNP